MNSIGFITFDVNCVPQGGVWVDPNPPPPPPKETTDEETKTGDGKDGEGKDGKTGTDGEDGKEIVYVRDD